MEGTWDKGSDGLLPPPPFVLDNVNREGLVRGAPYLAFEWADSSDSQGL
jgi:hypothetical protein